jgi:hypothetical protein
MRRSPIGASSETAICWSRVSLDFLRSLDALAAPELRALKLKTQYGFDDLKIVHTRHGAGDRKSGFDERCATFDFTPLLGQQYVDGQREQGRLRAHKIVGWPKLEVVRALNPKPERPFDNNRATAVYAPHFDQRLSS